MQVDLHSHTTASDGKLSPVELCERAVQCGVELLAITDHDTVAGAAAALAWLADSPDMPLQIVPVSVKASTGW